MSRPHALLRVLLMTTVILPAGSSIASGQRALEQAAYLDKLRGMWFGQLIGI